MKIGSKINNLLDRYKIYEANVLKKRKAHKSYIKDLRKARRKKSLSAFKVKAIKTAKRFNPRKFARGMGYNI